ncbi:MAG: hypothetical protein OXE43_13645 [Chloroflexi bacterium]|nr:hypothetical protein [Chloroflexota bacterium]
MSTIFLFIKFFDKQEYAQAFLEGKVFANRLSAFRTHEGEDTTGRIDGDEGTTSWLQGENVKLVLNGMDLSEGLMTLQVQMDSLSDFHLFCMHAVHSGDVDLETISHDNIEVLREALLVDDACLSLGPYAVVISDIAAFMSRLKRSCADNGYRGKSRLVKYYDPDTFHGTFEGLEGVFWKQTKFSFQREFRVAIDTHTSGEDPLTLEIGDISDIASLIEASAVNGEGLLGGTLSVEAR